MPKQTGKGRLKLTWAMTRATVSRDWQNTGTRNNRSLLHSRRELVVEVPYDSRRTIRGPIAAAITMVSAAAG